ENPEREHRKMLSEVFSHQSTRIGQAMWKPGRRTQQKKPRRLHRIARQDDGSCADFVLVPVPIKVDDTTRFSVVADDYFAGHALRANLDFPRSLCFGNVCHIHARLGGNRTAYLAGLGTDAGWASVPLPGWNRQWLTDKV